MLNYNITYIDDFVLTSTMGTKVNMGSPIDGASSTLGRCHNIDNHELIGNQSISQILPLRCFHSLVFILSIGGEVNTGPLVDSPSSLSREGS